MAAKFASTICLFFGISVFVYTTDASASPVLFYNFNDSGATTQSAGSASGESATFYSLNPSNSAAIVATDLHTAPGTGVAGDIVGSLLYGTDRAFNASGGIAVNTTSTAVSAMASWTVSGWYKPSTSLIGGSCFFQTPCDNGFGSAGFAIRANDVDDLRVGVGGSAISTTSNSFDPLNKWVFFAVTYNGSLASNNVKVYEGYRNAAEATGGTAAVSLVATLTLAQGTPASSVGYAMGARLNGANYASSGTLGGGAIIQSQPAIYDNFRVDSGTLSQAALEAYRVADISLAPNTFVWSSTSSSSWESGTGWTSGSGTTGTVADGASLIAIFGAAGSTGSAVLASGHTLGALTFMGSVSTTLSGSGTLTLSTTAGSAAISASGSNVVSAPMAFNASASASLASASQLTLGGSISGSGGLTVGGNGQAMLTGSNSYSGGTSVSGGTLMLGNANALQGSTFSPGAGLLAFQSGIGTFNFGGLSGSGSLVLTDTAGHANAISVGGNNQSTTFSGVLGGLGDLFKVGTGKLTLTNANSFTGDVTLNAGVLSLGNFYSMGNGGLVANGGTLDLAGYFHATNDLSGAAGIITNSTAGSPATLIVNQIDNTTFSGAINDGAGSVALYKSGPGTLTLANSSAYSGLTTVAAGVLSAGTAATLSPNSAVYVSGGTLDVSGHSQVIQSFTMNSAATLNVGNSNLLAITGAANLSGALNITGDTGAAALVTYGALYGRFTVLDNEVPDGYRLSYSSTALSVVVDGPAIWQAANGSWNDSLGWVGNIIPSGSGQVAVISAAAASPVTITLDGPQTLGTLTFGNTATASTSGYTLAAGSSGSLTMAGSDTSMPQVIVASGSNSIAANLTLTGSLLTTVAASSELQISGNIGESLPGSGVLVLSDSSAGTLVLSGTNNFSAAVVEAGTLHVSNAEALADGTSLTVGDASAFTDLSAGHVVATVTIVPEPGSIALLAFALGGGIALRLAAAVRRQFSSRGRERHQSEALARSVGSTTRILFAIVVALVAGEVGAQEIGGTSGPIKEATVSMPTRELSDAEKRCDMVNELADKSNVNYRQLSMKIMETWQSSIKSDKTFLKTVMRGDTVEFTVKKDGSIEIRGTEPRAKNKTGKGNAAKRTSRNEAASE